MGTIIVLLVTSVQAASIQVSLLVSSQSITSPGDVVADHPFTLECKITRPTDNKSSLTWTHGDGHTIHRIYVTRECTPSIPVSPSSPAGLSGGCQHVNGEEVYTVTIENVTEDTGRGRWLCEYGGLIDHVSLDVKVTVAHVSLTNPPDAVLAGHPVNFTCVTSSSKPKACIRGYIRSSGNVRELDLSADCNQSSSSPEIQNSTTRTLTSTASAEENGAELYCNASNSVTHPPVRSQVYTLSVHYIPRVVCSRTDLTVFDGQRIELSCDVMSEPEATVTWLKDGGQVDGVSSRTSKQHDVIVATLQVDVHRDTSPGIYEIVATNAIGTINETIRMTMKEGQPPEQIYLDSNSCINNQATLLWASDIDESVMTYYKLGYKGNQDVWHGELVRNPGRGKLVLKTLTDLQSGVFYQFTLGPVSDFLAPFFTTRNCTVTGIQSCDKERTEREIGLSKLAMLGVGIAVGALFGAVVICLLLHTRKLTWTNGDPEKDSNQKAGTTGNRSKDLPLGEYEDLNTRPVSVSGTQYEELSVRPPWPVPAEQAVYVNTTVM